jgi:hypothetical protein
MRALLGFIVGVAALALICISLLPHDLPSFRESPAFTPLAWSPDGKWLAFGVRQEYHTVGIYLLDVDSRRIHKIIEPLCRSVVQHCSGEIAYLVWAEDNETLFFGQDLVSGQFDYAVSRDGTHLRQIVRPEIPEQTSDIPIPSGCSDAEFIEARQTNNGLLAQSVCTENCGGCEIMHCTQELQLCDLNTGKIIYSFEF